MLCPVLILLTFLQSPLVSDEAAGSAQFAAAAADQSVRQNLSVEELKAVLSRDQYVPVPAEDVSRILRGAAGPVIPDAVADPAQIRTATYAATLENRRLTSGTLRLEFDESNRGAESGPVQLGRTSLQQLTVSDGPTRVPLGADSSQRLFLLKPAATSTLNGTWEADGIVTGDAVTFRLELPQATVGRFQLTTSNRTAVTSSNALVLGAVTSGDLLQWDIIPAIASRLTVNCRTTLIAAAGSPMPLAACSAAHVVSGDALNSRWAVSLPSDLEGRDTLILQLPDRVRVIDVTLNDDQPMEWNMLPLAGEQVSDPVKPADNAAVPLQQIRVLLPANAANASITVQGVSVLPATESWPLPLLNPSEWRIADSAIAGPVLQPTSQVSLTIPASMDLDGWTLRGLQERDVVAGPDNSRVFQLTRFASDATAIVHCSTSRPRITDNVVTVLDSAGRLATARCLINVQSEQAATIQLDLPITAEWDVISARYASDGRALFYERRPIDPVTGISQVTIHLPEAIEPQSSRAVSVQLQQSESAIRGLPRLPFPVGRKSSGNLDILVVMASQQQALAESGIGRGNRTPISSSQLQQLLPWLPSDVVATGAEIYRLSGEAIVPPASSPNTAESPGGSPAIAAESNIRRNQTEVVHAVVQSGEQIHETTRITLSGLSTWPDNVTVRIPADIESEFPLRWTLNGRSVSATRLPTAAEGVDAAGLAGWDQWVIPLSGLAPGPLSVVLGCESRRPQTEQFTARIALPENLGTIHGRIELTSAKSEPMVASGLTELTAQSASERRTGASVTAESLTRVFTLRDSPELIRVRTEHLQAIRSGEAIDAHIFHLISSDDEVLHHEIMAVAHLRRFGNQPSLPLLLPPGIAPLAVVDGQRVELIRTGHGFAVPLPEARSECDLMLCWKRTVDRSALLTTALTLSTVFRHQTPFQQSTHHLLTSPELDLRTPGASWTSSSIVDAAVMLRQVVPANDEQFLTTVRGTLPSQNSPRSFVSRWQVFSSLGWRHRTLVVAALEPTSGARILLTQVALRRATQYAALMVTLVGALAFMSVLSRFRRLAALTVAALAFTQFAVFSALQEAVVSGVMWGLASGVVLSAFRRPVEVASIAPANSSSARDFVLTAIAFAAFTLNGQAQENTGGGLGSQPNPGAAASPTVIPATGTASGIQTGSPPDVVTSDELSDSGIAWVRSAIFNQWQAGLLRSQPAAPEVIVTSLQFRIISNNPSSVEAVLSMEVAAQASEREMPLRLPLHQCRVVECLIDGEKVLPSADRQDAILITIPPTVLVRQQSLQPAENGGSKDALPDSDSSLPKPPESGLAAIPDPAAAWQIRRVECRLRPLTSRQPNGVQFRLPALPCPDATISVEDPDHRIHQAFVQTDGGSRQWKPIGEPVAIGGLVTEGGMNVRLLTASPTAVAQIPLVRFVTVCEKSSGQQLLTCIARVSQWNPLMQNLRLKIPEGFRLLSASGTGGTGLSWEVRDQFADLRVHDLQPTEFDIELRFVGLAVPIPLQQIVQISELAQFEGCQRSPKTIVALRTSAEFSVQQVGTDLRAIVSLADAPAEFAPWLRRSDVLFEVASGAGEVRFNLVPRVSYSEVHVSQSVRCQSAALAWEYRANIDTAILPVFRHRLRIDPAIAVTDVQVFAGEANRLDRWHLRGDQLIVVLKEGTTGLHRLSIRGTQKTEASAAEVRLNCPQLLDSQILESSLVIEDSGDSAFVLRETGGADPNQRVVPDQILTAGVPLKFQVVDETNPIVLRRRRSAPSNGTLAVLRSGDRAFVLMQIQSSPSTSESCRMAFAPDVTFIQPPLVSVLGQVQSTIRNGDEFRWTAPQRAAGGVEPAMFAYWVVPFAEMSRTSVNGADTSGKTAVSPAEFLSLPRFGFDVHWTESVVSQDRSLPADDKEIPVWIPEAMQVFEIPIEELHPPFEPLTITTKSGRDVAALPDTIVVSDADGDRVSDSLAVADTVVMSSPYESASAETTLVVFLPGAPDRLTVRIPGGTIVTRIDADQNATWIDNSRDTIRFDITRPVTVIRMRWLSERETGSVFATRFRLQPPFPENCQTRHLLTMRSSDLSASDVQCEYRSLAGSVFSERLSSYLDEGFRRIAVRQPTLPSSVAETMSNTTVPADAEQRASQVARFRNELDRTREEFFIVEHGGTSGSRGPWRFDVADNPESPGNPVGSPTLSPSPVPPTTITATIATITVRRIPTLSTLLPYAVSFFVVVIAILAGRKTPPGLEERQEPGPGSYGNVAATTKLGVDAISPVPNSMSDAG